MPCGEVNVVCSHDHIKDPACHPQLRENFRNITLADTNDENCVRNRLAYSCFNPAGKERLGTSYHYEHSKQYKETGDRKHLHAVAHSCPLGKVVCYADCEKSDCENDKAIIKAEDISDTRESIVCHAVPNETEISDDIAVSRERPCCAKKTSWTEPRICQCDPYDPNGYLKRCGCECGAAVFAEPKEEKPKKTVRFADEVVTCEDREKAFRNLDKEDVKHLCSCCRECAVIGEEKCVGKPVLVYELPEQKLEDTSVTQKDFCWQRMPPREVPPWHPNIKDRWHHMDVPSLCETTYQCDYRPPAVVCAERKPVYLAPQREKIDPCQQLAEEYCSWKKKSTGEKHTYHSTCDECDKDLHRVHLHECNVAHLPPQYQCHGDGHICQPSYHTTGEKFSLCEKGDTGDSRYWWKRTCCIPEKRDGEKYSDLPPDLMKPVCPPYTTSYNYDFKNPHRLQGEKFNFGTCKACETCTGARDKEQPNLLCTKDTQRHLITQRAGIM